MWSPDWVHGGAEVDHPGCKLWFLVSLPAHNLGEEVWTQEHRDTVRMYTTFNVHLGNINFTFTEVAELVHF